MIDKGDEELSKKKLYKRENPWHIYWPRKFNICPIVLERKLFNSTQRGT